MESKWKVRKGRIERACFIYLECRILIISFNCEGSVILHQPCCNSKKKKTPDHTISFKPTNSHVKAKQNLDRLATEG